MAKDTSDMGRLNERSKGQLGMLITIFLLGIAVNLMGEPEGGLAKAALGILLAAHVLVALGLIVGGALTVRAAMGAPEIFGRLARGGGAAIGIAFISGLLFLLLHSEWWSFLMAVAFIAAFVSYGALYVKVRVAQGAK